MKLMKEFREFAVKGNVIDLAVAVVIGGAFGKIVASFVGDVLMPPIGLALGGLDLVDLKTVLRPEVRDAAGVVTTPEVAVRYGAFVSTAIDFVIIAFCIFMLVKAINRLRRKQEAAPAPPPGPTKDQELLAEIRDLLRGRQA